MTYKTFLKLWDFIYFTIGLDVLFSAMVVVVYLVYFE